MTKNTPTKKIPATFWSLNQLCCNKHQKLSALHYLYLNIVITAGKMLQINSQSSFQPKASCEQYRAVTSGTAQGSTSYQNSLKYSALWGNICLPIKLDYACQRSLSIIAMWFAGRCYGFAYCNENAETRRAALSTIKKAHSNSQVHFRVKCK